MKFKTGFAAAAITLLSVATASAQLAVGTGWHSFSFGAGTVNSPFDAFAMSEASPFQITITDAFNRGDQFRLSWTGDATGFFDTGAPINDGAFVTNDPDLALADPTLSHGSAIFGTGSYQFVMTVLQNAQGFPNGGGAFIRADVVTPEPATFGLMATGLVGLAGMVRRRRKA